MFFLLGDKSKYLKKAELVNQQVENWQIEKENLEKQSKIRHEYQVLTESTPSKLSMSKKALIFLFINCTMIEIFTGWVTIRNFDLAFAMGIMPDYTPLVALIGAIVGEVIGLASYYVKSTKENTRGGITFESAAAQNFGIGGGGNPPVG